MSTMRDVQSGAMLPQPQGCPDDVFDLIADCQEPDPANRPFFDVSSCCAKEGREAGQEVPVCRGGWVQRCACHARPFMQQIGCLFSRLPSPPCFPLFNPFIACTHSFFGGGGMSWTGDSPSALDA